MALMVTCGGDMSGYCSIGDTAIDTTPASTISSEMTAERIGRSMKKCVNIELLFVQDFYRLSRHDAQRPVYHHAIPALQAADDDDVLAALELADDHRAQLGGAVRLDHVHQVPVGALRHRELRHHDRVRAEIGRAHV